MSTHARSFSIIIPAYNASRTLGKLLESIQREFPADTEVIVVDDRSTDDTVQVVQRYPGVQLLALEHNRGPGHARNRGVAASTGEILIFLDADVVLCADFRGALVEQWEGTQDPKALVGMLALRPADEHRFARYKAAHMYGYTLSFIQQTGGTGANFTTQCGIIERALFDQVGGFRETAGITWIEDDEFGYRLGEHATIKLCPQLVVGHHFDRFGPCVKKMFKQARLWTHNFLFERQRFDNIGKTPSEALGMLSASAAVAGALCSVLFLGHPLPVAATLLAVSIFVFSSRGLLWTSLREYGPAASLYALCVHGCIGLAVTCGAAFGLLPLEKSS
ncbi:MAG: glycosyltransferase [Pseudomonadota bacterium]